MAAKTKPKPKKPAPKKPRPDSTDSAQNGLPAPLRLEWLDADQLADNPSNWRRHPEPQAEALKAVLEEVGWAGALLYNERTKRLVDGHLRKKVAQGQKVPVLVGDWTEEQERKILATLDPIAAMAEADKGKLDALLRGVQTGSEALAEMLTELAEREGVVSGLNGQAAPEDAGPQLDRAAELQEKWEVKLGQLWVIPSKSVPGKEHRLLCGDSTKAEDVARVMGGEKAFLMVTDPPYGVEYDPEWRHEAAEKGLIGFHAKRNGKVANDDRVDWSEAYRLSGADVVYVWHASWFIAETQRSLIESGYLPRSQVIWAKDSFSISRGHYHWQHEPCWYAVRKGATAKWSGDRSQTTIWKINKNDGSDQGTHGTQKPVECMARPMRNHGEKGDLVYDPFLGSGTTIVAGEQTGRLVYGIEVEPKYCAVILERLSALGLEPRPA